MQVRFLPVPSNSTNMEIVKLSLSVLEQNKGQVDGLPSNLRQWTKSDVDSLAKSLRETPELFEARPIIVFPHEGRYVILGGNMRYEASKQNKVEEVPCVIFPESTPVEKLKEIVIKDNGSFGKWDYDMLGNEWDNLPLPSWGVPAWDVNSNEEKEKELQELVEFASLGTIQDYSEDTNYDLSKLFRVKGNVELERKIKRGIKAGQIKPQVAELFRLRLAQCSLMNFDEIIKYYRSLDSSKLEKELLKKLYLVFITPREAIEAAMLKMEADTGRIFEMEFSDNEMEEE